MKPGRPAGATTYEAEPAIAFGKAVRAARIARDISQDLISPDSQPWKLLAARNTGSGHGVDCIMAVASRGSISRKRNRRLKR